MNTEEKLELVRLQRDALRECLLNLTGKIQGGVYNNMLPDTNTRNFQTKESAETKCKNGFTRREALRNMGRCCLECVDYPCGRSCHLGYDEYEVFNEMKKAEDLIGRPDAEIPKISPKDFASYDPRFVYHATPRWIAQQLYRFSSGYAYADHKDKKSEKEWENALDNTLCICLGRYGYAMSIATLDAPKIKTAEEAHEFFKNNPEKESLYKELGKYLDPDRTKSIVKGNKSNESLAEELVRNAAILRLNYDFGRDYPGGDMDIYDGACGGLVDMCLEVAGIKTEDGPDKFEFNDENEYEKKRLEFDVKFFERLYAFLEEEIEEPVRTPNSAFNS